MVRSFLSTGKEWFCEQVLKGNVKPVMMTIFLSHPGCHFCHVMVGTVFCWDSVYLLFDRCKINLTYRVRFFDRSLFDGFLFFDILSRKCFIIASCFPSRASSVWASGAMPTWTSFWTDRMSGRWQRSRTRTGARSATTSTWTGSRSTERSVHAYAHISCQWAKSAPSCWIS